MIFSASLRLCGEKDFQCAMMGDVFPPVSGGNAKREEVIRVWLK
jgi:hypothetical protein